MFGPGEDGARLEGSKVWMKRALVEADVPTARFATFDDSQEADAISFLRDLPGFYVVKTDGLAAGKGVFVTESLADAIDDVRAKLSGSVVRRRGHPGRGRGRAHGAGAVPVVRLRWRAHRPPRPARDYKRVGDGDEGPNTGGMGAFSPVPAVGDDLVAQILETIVEPTVRWLRRNDVDYRGVLYAGLMLTPAGPKAIEYNVRFGDPEAEAVLPRMTSDLTALLAEASSGHIRTDATFSSDAAVTVMCAAEGYPGAASDGRRDRRHRQPRVAWTDVHLYCAGVVDRR